MVDKLTEMCSQLSIDTFNKEYIYYGKWVLVNAYFYKFWMSYDDFSKYNFHYK